MSVTNFESKFMSLLRFNGMWHTEERHAQMFMMGLRPDATIAQEIDTSMFIKGKDENAKSRQPGDKGKGKRPFTGSGGPQHQNKFPQQQSPHNKRTRSRPAGQESARGQGQQLRIEAPPVVPRIEGQVRAIQEIQQGHIVPYVPGDAAQPTGRVYAVIPCDHGANKMVVEGTFVVNSFPACILFDFGASHSFISYDFSVSLQLMAQPLDFSLSVSTPLGETSLLECVCRRCIVILDDSKFVIDLIVLRMSEFDVILGNQFAESYLAYVEDVMLQNRGADLSEMRVASEFQDVF
ncbi:uncharacterized protein LOC109821012 [Asparagus officinalis]|uniref:uncharacterized protein LOC109821012 n=1 Tax=Asparagus officinalis TaxID=4686 RepID=UPI00098E40D1|nr:uncharacterized protein LOC109821012 [Asparagus officinalis]